MYGYAIFLVSRIVLITGLLLFKIIGSRLRNLLSTNLLNKRPLAKPNFFTDHFSDYQLRPVRNALVKPNVPAVP
jgi:hypothetical protein